jgi:hypothetical protein
MIQRNLTDDAINLLYVACCDSSAALRAALAHVHDHRTDQTITESYARLAALEELIVTLRHTRNLTVSLDPAHDRTRTHTPS